jgi:hypothetical protein
MPGLVMIYGTADGGGVRLPGPYIEEAFNQAVETISASTRDLLARLEASAEQAGGLAHALMACVPAGGRVRWEGLWPSHGGGV